MLLFVSYYKDIEDRTPSFMFLNCSTQRKGKFWCYLGRPPAFNISPSIRKPFLYVVIHLENVPLIIPSVYSAPNIPKPKRSIGRLPVQPN